MWRNLRERFHKFRERNERKEDCNPSTVTVEEESSSTQESWKVTKYRSAELHVAEVPSDLATTSGVLAPAGQNINVEGATNCPVVAGDVKDPTFNLNVIQNKQQNSSNPDASVCGTKEHKNTPSPSRPRPSPAQLSAADSCEEELRSIYEVGGSYLQVNSFEDDDQRHYRKISTKLEIDYSNIKKPILVEEILHLKIGDGDPVKRAILNGPPGNGKTTLMEKMAYDWARKEAHLQFKLVFLLKMSVLNQGSNVIDAIYEQLFSKHTQVKRDDLESFIQHNQDEVLILLDGFDKFQTTSFSEHKFGSVLKILNQKILKDCWVVVTTRPSHFDKLVTELFIQTPYAHVRVLGFNEEDISEYVHKFYSEEQDQEKVDGLLEVITESYILSDLATSPMLLLLFCLLWRLHSTLRETLWGIYNEAVNYMFGRKGIDREEISKIVIELGKVALRGLLSPDQSLSFNETEFDKETLDKAIKAGLLTRQRVLLKGFHPQDQIQFLHKTMQEFCAGEFFKNLCTYMWQYNITLHSFSLSLRENARSLEYLLRFCCGNSKHCTNDILKIYHKVWESDSEWVGRSVLGCYFESQIKSLPPSKVVDMIIKPKMYIECNRNDMVVSFNYFVKCLVAEPTGKGKKYLGKVREVQVKRIGRSADVNLIFDSLSCMNNLVGLDLSRNGKLGGKAASWAHHLKQVKELQTLGMFECGLIGEDMNHIFDSLSCMNKLGSLDLAFNLKLGGTAASWAHRLKQVKQLQVLEMSRCGLIPEDMNPIFDSLSCMNNLVELHLLVNDKLGGTVAGWAHRLKQVKQLQKLSMSWCELTADDESHLNYSLSPHIIFTSKP